MPAQKAAIAWVQMFFHNVNILKPCKAISVITTVWWKTRKKLLHLWEIFITLVEIFHVYYTCGKLGVIVPGPRPKIGPSRHIEGNLLSNIPNESSGPEDFRSASNFFGKRVENGLKGAYCSKPPATWHRLPSALQAHSTLSGYDSGLVCWNSFI